MAASEPSRRTVRRVRAGLVSVPSVVLRFAAAGLVSLMLVTLATAFISREIGTSQGVEEARRIATVTGRGIVEPAVEPGVLVGDPESLMALDRIVRRDVLQNSLVRVRIWAPDGTVLYADDERLLGRRFALDTDALDVLAGGPVHAEVSDLSMPENVFEEPGSRLLEAYVPITAPDGTPLLFEAYFRLDSVAEAGRRTWLAFAPVVIAALVILQAVQIPLAWSMARRLRGEQERREQLLRMAVDASDNERRRIAGDLHDGVVQDLTGIALGLTASARKGEPVPADTVAAAADSIRGQVQSLRTMLVELYPPDLATEGLEPALAELAARLEAKNVDVAVEVAPRTGALPVASAALVYRVTLEALRNIARHAEARRVNVRVVPTDEGGVELTIDDDGRGFDVEAIGARDGHLGLQVMADLADEAGATLSVASAPGAGTCIRLLVGAAP